MGKIVAILESKGEFKTTDNRLVNFDNVIFQYQNDTKQTLYGVAIETIKIGKDKLQRILDDKGITISDVSSIKDVYYDSYRKVSHIVFE